MAFNTLRGLFFAHGASKGSIHRYFPIVHELVLIKFKLVVVASFLRGRQASLVLSEPSVGHVSDTQGVGFETLSCMPADGIPHDKIVRSAVLELKIGGPVCIRRIFVPMKNDRTSNWFTFDESQRHVTLIGGKNLLEDVAKEKKRLREKTLPLLSQISADCSTR